MYFYRNLLSREKGFEDYDAIIFVVDSADRNSLEEARQELWNVLCLAPNFMMQQHLTVLLIMANKQDVKGAATTQEIETILGPKLTLQNSVNGLKKGAKNDSEKIKYICFVSELKNLPSTITYKIQGTCAVTGNGLNASLEWLTRTIKENRRTTVKATDL